MKQQKALGGVSSLEWRLLGSGAASVLFSVGAFAQTADKNTETVVVTSTRLNQAGYSAPTPTTVMNAAQLQNDAQANISRTINQMPAVIPSGGTANIGTNTGGGGQGISSLNLRGFGTNRTLVLIDGQRSVPAFFDGTIDTAQFPQALIQRVDVVTGGASASWGSDAVAGVVNFVLDKNYNGFKAQVMGGETVYGDDQTGQITATYGTAFAGNKGQFEVSAEFAVNGGVSNKGNGIATNYGGRTWYQGAKVLQGTVSTTAKGQPEYIAALHVSTTTAAPGGIITAGPLTGIQFGPGGVPYQTQFGTPSFGSFAVGGDQTGDTGNGQSVDASLLRGTIYTRVSYNITPDVNVYATYNYGATHTSNQSFRGEYRNAGLTIQCDNAFLPATIVLQCAQNKITSFQYGTQMSADLPGAQLDFGRILRRYTVGGAGAVNVFGTDWSWDAYMEHGVGDSNAQTLNDTILPYYNLAIDSVVNPKNGMIVCRSTLTNPTNGCVPLNIIGTGVASPSALNYVFGGVNPFNKTANADYLVSSNHEDAGAVNFSGSPIQDWAGDVAAAFGVEYRQETFKQRASCAGNDNCGNPLFNKDGNNYFIGNYHAAKGNFHVIEGYAEFGIPLLKSDMFGNADMDIAGRAEKYSTAGYVNTWKVGLTYAPFDGVRFRALQSRDIRAPALSELFAAPSVNSQTVIDDFAPNAGKSFGIVRQLVSNLALKPEKAITSEVGVVLQPTFIPGLSVSVDYWRLAVRGIISALSNQQEMDACFAGRADLCALIQRNAAGTVTGMIEQNINLSSQVADGVDIEGTYRFDVADVVDGWDGSMTLHMIATHYSKFVTNGGTSGAPNLESAGQGSIPLWRWNGSETYSNDLWSLTFTERYITPLAINKSWIACAADSCPLPTATNPTVNMNRIAGAMYFDLGGNYKMPTVNGFNSQFYFKIDNVNNIDPPMTYSNGTLSQMNPGVNGQIFDELGRFYRIGVRINTN